MQYYQKMLQALTFDELINLGSQLCHLSVFLRTHLDDIDKDASYYSIPYLMIEEMHAASAHETCKRSNEQKNENQENLTATKPTCL